MRKLLGPSTSERAGVALIFIGFMIALLGGMLADTSWVRGLFVLIGAVIMVWAQTRLMHWGRSESEG